LKWLGYELVRHTNRAKVMWTWRRTKEEMTELHALIAMQANQHNTAAISETLERIARQPGFRGYERSRGHYARRRYSVDMMARCRICILCKR
jgi:hypothetical protein